MYTVDFPLEVDSPDGSIRVHAAMCGVKGDWPYLRKAFVCFVLAALARPAGYRRALTAAESATYAVVMPLDRWFFLEWDVRLLSWFHRLIT